MDTTINTNANTAAVQAFSSQEFGLLRVVEIDNTIWFVGKDVATILGYTNPRKALGDHVDEEDKKIVNLNTVTNRDAITGNPNVTIINESGLYSLILSSKLPTAKKFKHWVTAEVLPSIRKHGKYEITKETDEQFFARALIAANNIIANMQNRVGALEERVAIQGQQIAEMNPKAAYYDMILNCKNAVSITTIAKDYGMSGTKMNEMLHELNVQWKQNDTWVLMQKYAGKGYTCTKTHDYQGWDGTYKAKVHTYWTQKGRLFIYELLKNNGTLPLIEREQQLLEEDGDDDSEEPAA